MTAAATGCEPIGRLELVLNGEVVAESVGSGDDLRLELEAEVPITRSSWLAVRAFAPQAHNYRFAHTSPVYVSYAGQPIASADSADYFDSRITELIAAVHRPGWFASEEHTKGGVSHCQGLPGEYL